MPTLGERFKKSWNAFIGREPAPMTRYEYGTSIRPDRPRFTRTTERSMVNAIYNRIAVDVSAVDIRHVRLDENERYTETIDSGLNNCLTLDANIDQTGRAFIQDAVMSMFDEGCVALVPVDTDTNPNATNSYDILTMRTGKIVEWYPEHIKVNVYNERKGKREDITVRKDTVAIIENPFYSIMNEPNSTLQRLIRVLNNIDRTNEQNAAGKMDLIIQLPYLTKSETKKQQAEARRKLLEDQLTGSQYGIAYIDGTEHVTQLSRPIENNLWQQAQDLKKEVYNQLGLTEEIFNGTADERAMLDYQTRTLEPILSAFVEEMKRKFLTKTARTQGQSIKFFREPFKLVPIMDLANVADVFERNEILSSNEFRSILGYKPVDDGKSDELRNSNMPQEEQPQIDPQTGEPIAPEAAPSMDQQYEEIFNGLLDDVQKQIEDIVNNYMSDEEEAG